MAHPGFNLFDVRIYNGDVEAKTGLHTDSRPSLDADGNSTQEIMQEPGTDVVIFSIDATMLMWLPKTAKTREKASRGVTKWRQSKATHVDMLVGNYLSNYFQDLAEAIRKGAPKFKRPRRTDGMRFYDSCLPGGINFKTATIPKVRPAGRWDWFVYENATARFWESMQPLVEHTLDHAFDKCGIRATVSAPVLHFRCASAPLNRHSQYHFQRYSFYKAAARRYRRRFKAPLRQLHLLTCVADDFSNPEQTSVCTSYMEDLIRFLQTELQIEVFVSNCAHSMFEDLAIMYYAPFLISTGSTMSLLPGVARHVSRHTFVSPRLYDEESLAFNSRSGGRRLGCGAAALMARSCKAAGARPLSAAECQQAAGRQGYGRKWLGTTASATEAAGCVLWEEHGNVEYNAKTEQPVCNVRGTCLCKGSDGREVQIIGMPKYGKGVEGRELQASSSSPSA
ncbi:hypothetical protein Ctob_011067 [Chrysochromulina tobinii]|uniref:Uncharacterized protein n=1 Tax=Chrysochromulina tobinii TaxID=1460289 RepID=A0A0M0K6V7_9EUKA|nr:hypothetical protein Ctob_011067 [Chrysochromulina tobinii]|eukprot:KOO34535.1 hypothetical protein Ctob_011067 [Chrysochromulina sp. CCMP291]